MRWTYDATAGALYVAISEAVVASQLLVGPAICDLDADGNLVGVEVLSHQAAIAAASAVPDRFELETVTRRQLVEILMSDLVKLQFVPGSTAQVTTTSTDDSNVRLELATA